MASFKDTKFHGMINVTDYITLTEQKYNVADYTSSEGLRIADPHQPSLFQGSNITIGRTSSDNTEYVLLNGNRLRIRGIDKYTWGISDPISSGQLGQIYFKLITIA